MNGTELMELEGGQKLVRFYDPSGNLIEVRTPINYGIDGEIEKQSGDMSILGNILWFICGGLLSGLSWVLAGCLWCISIIGIPIGLQCFKFAGLAFFPFGKEVVYGGGAVSLIANIIWLIVSGIPMAVENAVAGLICCITIIGIPFGKQFFKIAKLSLMPFGAEVI